MVDALRDGISVVVPVYNSEATLAPLVDALHAVLPGLAGEWEIILVNDGSRDRSWEVVRGLAASHPRVRGLNMLRNFGQHNALLAGIRAARHRLTVTMDDDLQHPAEEIPKLLAALKDDVDVVYGTPNAITHSLFRDVMSIVTKFVLRHAMRTEVARNVSAFRLFRTHVREAFQDYRSPYVSIDALLTWGTHRFTAVQVEHRPRTIGRSNYDLRRLIVHALTLVTAFSTLPLRVASILGLLCFFFGAGVLVYVLLAFLVWGRVVPGFAFLASTVAILGGAQLLALGVIGEYLARMFVRLMGQPSYVVRETAGDAA
jgi:undecaprenyl-phosphate 4-deoxy-4-formamido-L-arabinose transferase